MPKVREIFCAAAGPAGSFLLLLLAGQLPRLALCGLVQGLFNLLPIYPMDGGRVLSGILELLIPDRGETVFRWVQILVIIGSLPLIFHYFFVRFWIAVSIPLILRCLERKRPCKRARIGVQ